MANRPDSLTLAAFLGFVLIGGSNIVAVRFSNVELEPFWGAAFRFALSGLLFLFVVAWRKSPWPRGRAMLGAFLFGLLNIGLFYAFAYYALVVVASGFAAVVLGLAPLVTYLLAVAQKLETFRWRALGGAAVALAGLAFIFREQVQADVPYLALFALLGATLSAAQATIVVKRFPRVDPYVLNTVAMAVGASLLLALSVFAGESWTLPTRGDTLTAFLYLVTLGGLGLFTLVLYVLNRWTASGTSYGFVLFPVVATSMGAWLANEPVTWTFVGGSLIVLLGVYVGAIGGRAPTAPSPAAAAEAPKI